MPEPIEILFPFLIGNRVAENLAKYFEREREIEIIEEVPDTGYAGAGGYLDLNNSSTGFAGLTGQFELRTRKVKVRTQYRAKIKKINDSLASGVTAFMAVSSIGAVGAPVASAIAGLSVGGTLVSLGILGFVGGAFTTIWSIAVSTTSFVLNFNLNISDEELDKQIESRLNSLYGLLGGTVGRATGYLVCGALPGTIAFAFNPGMAAAAMAELDEEARQEVYQSVALIAASGVQTLINAELSNRFKSARRFLKANPDNPFSKFVRQIIGEENFRKWGESNRPSFTIQNDIIEKSVEAIPDARQRAFLENFLEEFSDACIESGFIVANNFDSYLAAQSLMQRQIIGKPTDVTITIDD